MKKFLFISSFILTFYPLFGQKTNISLTVNGIQDSTAIIGYHYGRQRLIYDTLSFDQNNTINLSTQDNLPRGLYFIYTPNFYSEFILSEPEFSIVMKNQNSFDGVIVTGSKENELFVDFQQNMGELQRKQRALTTELESLSGDDSLKVVKELELISTKTTNYQDSVISGNQGTFFAEFISLMRGKEIPDFMEIEDEEKRKQARYEYLKSTYFEGINVGDLMRTPVIDSYVSRYFKELVSPNPDSINTEIDKLMQSVEEDESAFRYWLVTFFNMYQESNLMGMDAVTAHLVENYYLTDKVSWISEESKAEMRKELQFIKPNIIGKQAPPFTLQDTEGKSFTLNDFQSEYLVLYFYDPDCGICRKKTPILKESYEDLKSENTEVIAVCTITDGEKWKEYIEEKELNWVNLADLGYRDNFRMNYNVRSTPQLYVLDKDRKIIAKKLDVSQVLQFIQDHKRLFGNE